MAEFVAETGVDSAVAYSFLQAKGWDLNQALRVYLCLRESCGDGGTKLYNTRWSAPVTEENGNVTYNQHHLARPTLQKCDAIDISDMKKLTRGISRATENVNLVSRARSDIALDFKENAVCSVNQYFIETPVYTFTLPDLTVYSEDFRGFLEKDLIEMSSLVSLEQSGRLNWWADSGAGQRLWPLATTGDGNCLLHAASLGMWGFHDRLLTLRKALHGFLTGSKCKDALWRRWRWQQTRLNAEAGFVYTEDEWKKEWESIVNMASTEPRKPEGGRRRSMIFEKNPDEVSENATYESLEEVHVLALAHVLRRPIIVIADLMLKDVDGEDLAPIPFGGIYLPLECSPADCRRSPLVLTYDAAHFSALVVMEDETFEDKMPHPPAVIPLTDSEHKLLPIQFSTDPGEQYVWGRDEHKLTVTMKDSLRLLHDYMDVIHVAIPCEDNAEFLSEMEADALNDEDDVDKKYEMIDVDAADEAALNPANKSKAAKQLQSVAKQFGSIGKSMSKKLKKNFGSIAKMTRNNSQKKASGAENYAPSGTVRQTTKLNSNIVSRSQDYILCAELHTEKRHEYQEEMVRNYLQSARKRFERDKELKQKQAEECRQKEEMKLKELAQFEGPSSCINPGCDKYGTALTSYMCKDCFQHQQQQELDSCAPRYGIGKSRFYTESDLNSHNAVSRLPATRVGNNVDQTLYLSKSTFYNDVIYPPCSVRPGMYIHELIPAYNIQDSGFRHKVLSSRYNNYQEDTPLLRQDSGSQRIHSYNLARSWDSSAGSKVPERPASLGRTGSQQDFRHNPTNLNDSRTLPQSTTTTTASGSSARNVSVATLSPLSSNDLTNVEQVGGIRLPISGAQPCRTNNCKFFGSADSDYYCSKCFKEQGHGSAVKSLKVQEMKRY